MNLRPSIGETLAGRYELRETLRECPTRIVYRAFDTEVEVEVALWWMRRALFPDPEAFRRRVTAMKAVRHAHLVRLFDLCEAEIGGESALLLALQLGTDSHLERALVSGQPAADGEVLRYAEGLVGAVQAAHDHNTLHGWLTPGDVVEVAGQIKLCAAGLFAAMDAPSALRSWGRDARYLAPELAAGAPPCESSDWYSVAAILVDLATGSAGLELGQSMARLEAQSPGRLAALSPALSAQPGERPNGVLLIDAIRRAWPDPYRDDSDTGEDSFLPTVIDDQGRSEYVMPYDPRTPAAALAQDAPLALQSREPPLVVDDHDLPTSLGEEVGVVSFLEDDDKTQVRESGLPAPSYDPDFDNEHEAATLIEAAPDLKLDMVSMKPETPVALKKAASAHQATPIKPILRPLSSLAPVHSPPEALGTFAPPRQETSGRGGYWLYLLLALVAGALVVSVVLALSSQEPEPAEEAGRAPAAETKPSPVALLAEPKPTAPAPSAATPTAGPCPQAMVLIEGFCIDAHEHPGAAQRPTVVASAGQAEALCREREARLCQAEEWERACRREGRESWPYGDRFQSEICNLRTGEIGLTGARTECVTELGIYDMSGNIAEWVAGGEIRGGSALDRSRGRCSQTRAPKSRPRGDSDLGFRCCADAIASSAPSD